MKVIDSTNKISLTELETMSENRFGDLVKAVVDVEKGIMAVDAELHSDQEKELLTKGSNQEYLWGINLYPSESGVDFIEFDSMINLRPSWGNLSIGVDDLEKQNKIIDIVSNLIER